MLGTNSSDRTVDFMVQLGVSSQQCCRSNRNRSVFMSRWRVAGIKMPSNRQSHQNQKILHNICSRQVRSQRGRCLLFCSRHHHVIIYRLSTRALVFVILLGMPGRCLWQLISRQASEGNDEQAGIMCVNINLQTLFSSISAPFVGTSSGR